jgi:N-acetylneuraminic acid mutarotase
MRKVAWRYTALLVVVLSLVNVITVPSYSQTQVSWENAGKLPNPLSCFAVGVNDKQIYVIGGRGPSVNVYYASILDDGNIGEWRSTTPLPEGRCWTSQQEAVIYDDRIYVIGGSAPRPPHRVERDTVWYAEINPDGSLENWISTTPLPDHITSHLTVLWNKKIYIIGGWTGYQWLNTVYYAEINPDGSIDSWESTTFPEERGHNQAGIIHKGTISGSTTN